MKARLIVIAICAALVAVGYAMPSVLNALFNVFDMAFGWAGGFVVVTLISGLVGILFLLAFPHVSSQKGIVAVKDKIKSKLLAIRIFQDDIRTVTKSTGTMFLWNFGYLGLNMLPMVVLAAPFMVVWFQLNALYAFDPLEAGVERMVVAEFSVGTSPQDVEVTVVDAEGNELPFAMTRVNLDDARAPRMILSFTPEVEGDHELVLTSGGESVHKTMAVGETSHRRLARIRTSEPLARFAAAEDPMVYFGEPVIPAGSFVRAVTVDYPPASLGFLAGGEIDIMILFVLVSLVVGFALKGAFGVEI